MSSGRHNVIWNSSLPDELTPGYISSRWLIANAGCYSNDLRCCPMSSKWHSVIWSLTHSDELAPDCISSDDLWPMHYVIRTTLCNLKLKSSGWVNSWLVLICPGHIWFDDLGPMHYVIRMTYTTICHPDDFGISSGWVIALVLCHPDDIRFHS